jgi:hypothetical protein
MRKLAILVALALVAGLMALGRGQVLADDPIDCSHPANAELEECDPTSSITLTSSKDGQTVAPGATIDWTVTAICTGTQQQCQNAGTWVNGPVPNGYIVRIIGPRNSCNQAATTPLVVEVTTLGGTATGTPYGTQFPRYLLLPRGASGATEPGRGHMAQRSKQLHQNHRR